MARWLARFIVFVMCIGVGCFSIALSEECGSDWPPPHLPPGLPCPQAHSETIELEHEDRRNRLLRLSTAEIQPSFSTEVLQPEEHGQIEYPGPIPVLRVAFNTDVFFDTASSTILPEAYPVLKTIADNLQLEPPDVALYVVGHTDYRGDENYNYNLGLDRANAVAEAIARRGIYQAAIYRLSFGEGFPIDTGTDDASLARNRRVEFLFAGTPTAGETYIRRIAASPCIAIDENGVQTCRRPVTIEVKKVAVSPEFEKRIVELNTLEESVLIDSTLTEVERETRLNEIELTRNRFAIMPQRERVPIIPNRQIAPTPNEPNPE